MTMKDILSRMAKKPKLRVAGLMSGTSADGVATAIVDIGNKGIILRAFATYPYSRSLRQKLFTLFDPATARLEDLCSLNFILGEVFARSVMQLCRQTKIPLDSIDLIGSHGQTIYHDPQGVRYQNHTIRSTLQIGEPSVIAYRTGITTIADFRVKDVAAGGQGAPLVPYADYFLFRDQHRSRAIQNIGGIANVTYLPAGVKTRDIMAFDTGPGNMVIDRIVERLSGGKKKFDRGGRLAAAGVVDKALLKRLRKHPYFHRNPPKTTGREEFGASFSDCLYQQVLRKKIAPADLVATVTALTAHTIAEAYQKFLPALPDEMILCGGGAHNRTLAMMLHDCLPTVKMVPMEELGVGVDAKEAVSFAILAWAAIRGLPNNVPSATGAEQPVILGKIVPAL